MTLNRNAKLMPANRLGDPILAQGQAWLKLKFAVRAAVGASSRILGLPEKRGPSTGKAAIMATNSL
tara:strand:- start:38793 stop:38990 length:198 start_codon:yes stop_codon:yes gene_type:complete